MGRHVVRERVDRVPRGGPHGVGISSTLVRRRAQYTGEPYTHQNARSLVYYALLGDGLGAAPPGPWTTRHDRGDPCSLATLLSTQHLEDP